MNKKMLFWSVSLLTAAVVPTAVVLKVQNTQLVNNEIEAINIAKNQQMNQGFDLKFFRLHSMAWWSKWSNCTFECFCFFTLSRSFIYCNG